MLLIRQMLDALHHMLGRLSMGEVDRDNIDTNAEEVSTEVHV